MSLTFTQKDRSSITHLCNVSDYYKSETFPTYADR